MAHSRTLEPKYTRPARIGTWTWRLVLLGALALPLQSCGGGGSDAGAIVTLAIVPDAPGGSATDGDGHCSAFTCTNDGQLFVVGDGAMGTIGGSTVTDGQIVAFLYFPLTDIAAGARVLDAKLHLVAGPQIGDPIPSLGVLEFVRIAASTPQDPFAVSLAATLDHDPSADVVRLPAFGDSFVVDLSMLASAAVAAGEDLFVRLQFSSPSNNNDQLDVIRIASTTHLTSTGPRLEITVRN